MWTGWEETRVSTLIPDLDNANVGISKSDVYSSMTYLVLAAIFYSTKTYI